MTLIEALDQAPDPQAARLKLRAMVRRLVDEIWVLVVPMSPTRRLCAMQVFFASGARREFLIRLRSAGHRRRGGWQVRLCDTPNWAPDTEARFGVVIGDLRDRGEAAVEAEALARLTERALDLTFARCAFHTTP
jgi:hypothetical protein